MEPSVTKFLWKYARKLKWFVFALLLLIILSTFLFSFRNYLFSQIVGFFSDEGRSAEIYHKAILYTFIIFAVLISQSTLESYKSLLDARFMPYYMSKVSKDLFIIAHRHSSSFFAEEMAGNVSGKIKTILNNTERAYMHLTYGLMYPVINMSMILGFIFFINVSLAGCFLTLNLLTLFIMVKLKRKVVSYAERRSKLNSESTGVMIDSITNSDLVKNFGNLQYEKQHYYRSVKNAAKAFRIETFKIAVLDFFNKLSFDTMNLLFYLLVSLYWYKFDLSIADVVLAVSLIGMLVNAVRNIGFFATEFSQLVGGIRDGLKLLSKPCEITDSPNAEKLEVKDGNISFKKITYHYKSSQPLFRNFSLEIKPGEKIGLVGRSGSGKSTLIKLLSRYYDVQKGAVLIDGQDVKGVTQDSLHKNIAMIPQDPSLFNRTIMENIRYGNTRASDEEVYEAAKKAYIHETIMQLPNGYQSKVGERGVMLSGGERQRIAIARAILKNAPILILDEATSALDSESEKYIQNSMKELMKGKTVIAIAHRLSTLKEMDKLVVMDKGEIVEKGTHKTLIRKKGMYYNFYNMQSSGFLQIEK